MKSRTCFLVASTVWLDFARRKDFYVVAILLSLSSAGILAARIIGIENESTGRFLLSMGLGLSNFCAALLTAVFAARALPEEFENRTLLPLLAKPVGRAEAIWGKFLGVFAIALASLSVLTLLSWIPAPKAMEQSLLLFAQAMVLQGMSLVVLIWLTMWLSLWMPGIVAGLIGMGIFLAGGPVCGLVIRRAGEASRELGWAFERVLALAPDFTAFDFTQSYVDGAPALQWGVLGILLSYGAIGAAFFAALSIRAFARRSL